MTQLAMFPEDTTVPSPLCPYSGPCPHPGRATLGPVERVGPNCTTRAILCACGRTGTQSVNTEPRKDTR